MILLYYRLLQLKEKIRELKAVADKEKVLSRLLETIEKVRKETSSCKGGSSARTREEYAQNQLSVYGYANTLDLTSDIKAMQGSVSQLPALITGKESLTDELNKCMSEYAKIQQANVVDYSMLEQTTPRLRDQLSSVQHDGYDETLFHQSVHEIDYKLKHVSEPDSAKIGRSHLAY